MIILIICIIYNAIPAFAAKTSLVGELKAGVVFLLKMSIGVIISAVIIGLGLWFYRRIKIKKDLTSNDSNAENFTCEIDETKTIDEAIRTFLKINEK